MRAPRATILRRHSPSLRLKETDVRSARLGVLFLVLLLLASVSAAEDMVKVTVDLADQTVIAGIPFDEPFIITGAVNPQVQRLHLVVHEVTGDLCVAAKRGKLVNQISTDPCHKTTIGDPITETQEWNRRVGGSDNFQFTLPALAPYSCYSLVFTQFVRPATEPQRIELQKQLGTLLRDKLAELMDNNPSILLAADTTDLQKVLRNTAQAFVTKNFQACLPEGVPDLTEGTAREARRKLQSAIAASANTPDAVVNPVATTLCLTDCEKGDPKKCDGSTCTATQECWKKFIGNLEKVLEKPDLLAAGPKTWWEQPLNAGREATKTVTIAQATAAFVAGVQRRSLRGILEGTSRINGPVIESSPRSPASIELLSDYYDVLSSPFFVMKSGERVMPAGLAACQSAFATGFAALAEFHRKQLGHQATLETPTFADILAESFLSQEFQKAASPTIITETKNPYISMDVGLAYGFRLDKAFPYYGANFYFAPVNKRAPLNRFEGMERVKKSFSLLLGVTAGSFDDDRNKKFFSGGSVLLGAGWRFNQFVKVNGGALLFKQVDPNPIVVVDRKKTVPFVSFSIDIDLKTLLGTNVGGIFQ
jgi:hypothetical protein